MTDSLRLAAALIGIFFALLYGWAIAKMWLTFRFPLHQPFERIDPLDPVIPPAVHDAIEKRGKALAALGFHSCGVVMRVLPKGHTVFAALYDLPDGSIRAGIVAAVPRGRQTARRITVNLVTDLADDTKVSTNDAVQNPPMSPAPSVDVHRFPGLADLARLLSAHRRIVASHGTPISPRATSDDPARYFAERTEEEMERHASAGTVVRTHDAYRLTLPAAALAVWRLALPTALIVAFIAGLRAQRELKALGV